MFDLVMVCVSQEPTILFGSIQISTQKSTHIMLITINILLNKMREQLINTLTTRHVCSSLNVFHMVIETPIVIHCRYFVKCCEDL